MSHTVAPPADEITEPRLRKFARRIGWSAVIGSLLIICFASSLAATWNPWFAGFVVAGIVAEHLRAWGSSVITALDASPSSNTESGK